MLCNIAWLSNSSMLDMLLSEAVIVSQKKRSIDGIDGMMNRVLDTKNDDR